MLDTELTMPQIEVGIAHYFNFRQNLVVPNVSWGLLNHEADIIVMSRSGYLTEVEIKRSWSDFLADFKKRHGHKSNKVSFRYFAVPLSIADKCKERLAQEDPEKKWGLLTYQSDVIGDGCWVSLEYYPSNISVHDASRRLSDKDQYQLARLGAMRIWGMKSRFISLLNENDALRNECKRLKSELSNGNNSKKAD